MITDHWLGHATTGTAKVCARSDTTGTVTLTCNGVSYSAAADTAVNDGIVVFDVSGLSPNRSYSYTVGAESGTLITMPQSGEFNFLWFSCAERRSIPAFKKALDLGIIGSITLGDTPYTESTGSANGVSFSYASTTPTQANAEAHHLATIRGPSWQELMRSVPFYKGADDHEWPGDNWDHNPEPNAGTNPTVNEQADIAANQGEADAIYVLFRNALDAYALGNPDNKDADALPQAHPVSTLPDSSYPVFYYRFTIGNVEFFYLDCISHRSWSANTDDSNKTMLGTTQKAWLKAHLSSSTATFKAIFSPKRLWGNVSGAGNEDEWGDYSTERDEILAYIEANVTGVVWLTGDQHCPHVSASTTAADATPDVASTGDAFSSVDVCACPIAVPSQSGLTTVTQNRQFWEEKAPNNHIFGILHVTENYIEPRLYDSATGNAVWSGGRIYAGENRLTYHNPKISI